MTNATSNPNHPNPLHERVALVTGGSRGIGRATALELARAGARVAITYQSNQDAANGVVADIERAGGKALALQMDAVSKADTTGIVSQVKQAFGRLDIVVLNAGAIRAAPVWDTSDEDYETLMKVNVDQVFHVTRAAAPVLPEGGRIIAIGSVNADKMPMPGIGVYGATKAAVAALVQGWARDLAPKGITINTVQPGPIDTDMNPDGGPFTEYVKPHTAMNRYGKAEEVARVVRFLASPDSSYVTGARIDVDGGFKS